MRTLLLLATVLWVTAPAAAQGHVLYEGVAVQGVLSASSDTLASGEYVDTYALEVTSGDPFELVLTSGDFDTYLIAQQPGGAQLDNDDWEESGSESRVRVEQAEAGEWSVLVTTYAPGETGAYVLAHRPLSPARDVAGSIARADSLDLRVIALYRAGRSAEAERAAREAVALREGEVGPDHASVATSLNNLAVVLEAQGLREAARPVYERALAIRRAALGSGHPLTTQTLLSLASLLRTQGGHDAAQPLWEEAFDGHPEIVERLRDPSADVSAAVSARVGALIERSHQHRLRSEYAEGVEPLEEAIGLIEIVQGENSPLLASALSTLAAMLGVLARHDEAIAHAERALGISESAHGPNHPNVARVLATLGYTLTVQGRRADARPLLERALRIYEHTLGPDAPEVGDTLGKLADLLQRQGDYSGARALEERALALAEEGGDPHTLVLRLNALASVLIDQGEHAAARPLFERAIRIGETQIADPALRQTSLSQGYNNLASLLNSQGDYATARPLYERVLRIDEDLMGPDHPVVATALSNLGGVLYRQRDYAAARPLLERALAIREATFSPDHPKVASSLNDLASVLRAQGDTDGAREVLERALAIRETALGPDHPDTAQTLNNLGFLLDLQRDHEAARPLLERSLAIWEAAYGPSHPQTGTGASNLALHFETQGDYTAARPLRSRSAQLRNQFVESVLSTLSAAEQRYFIGLNLDNEAGILLSTHREGAALDEAYRIVGGWKGLLLRELRRQSVLSELAASPAHAETVRRLRSLRNRVARSFQEGGPDLAALTQEKEALERQLLSALPEASVGDPWRALGPGGLGAVVPEGTAFVDVYRHRYWERGRPTGSRYIAIVTGPGSGPALFDLGDATRLEAAVARWRDAVLSGDAAEAEMAALVESLWAPLVAALPEGTRRVWVSPDAQVARVPWAVVAEAHGAGALVTEVPSGRSLARLLADQRPPGSTSSGLLLVGGVDFGGEGAPFAPLPGTAAEADGLARLASRADVTARVLRGVAPTPPAVVESMQRAAYVHLATHGYFYAESPAVAEARSAIGPDVEREVSPEVQQELSRNPLAESGLALAGANAEGGRLTAEEIVGLDLSGTRLVVLSACDTGRGHEVTGQGVLGLRASIEAAGAGAVLMSLWSVPDAATAFLMERFYAGLWTEGLSPAEALREAQAAVRARPEWEAPLYWAAWTLSGDAFTPVR